MSENKIALLRKERGWTQDFLAEKSNVNIRTIQRLEGGKDVSLETLKSIAQSFNVQIKDSFVTLDDSKKSTVIIEENHKQDLQFSKWNSLQQLYSVAASSLFIIFMIVVGEIISDLDFNHEIVEDVINGCWIIAWPLGFVVIYLVKSFIVIPFLNEKYPLAIRLNQKNTNGNNNKVIITISVLIFIVVMSFISEAF